MLSTWGSHLAINVYRGPPKIYIFSSSLCKTSVLAFSWTTYMYVHVADRNSVKNQITKSTCANLARRAGGGQSPSLPAPKNENIVKLPKMDNI